MTGTDSVTYTYIIYIQNTFTFKTLFHQAKQHLATEVAEMWRLVGVNVKNMRSNLQFLHCSACYQQRKHTNIDELHV